MNLENSAGLPPTTSIPISANFCLAWDIPTLVRRGLIDIFEDARLSISILAFQVYKLIVRLLPLAMRFYRINHGYPIVDQPE